ncbi:MAG TPA: hypothetical protein VHB79_36140 [Polyangiaceae bacterium]|nr:hypothetical protein [Polyangiaceae bacterium]
MNATAQRGNSTSTPSVLDECPPGSVLVGVNAEVNQGIVARLQGVCGVPTIRTNQPGGVFIEAGETLPLEGNVDGTPVTRSCPDGAVIVGFEGRSGQLLDQLRLHCARLLVADGTIVFGTLQPLEPIGESGGMPFQRAACPEGALATGTNASVDEWISSFGMPCASVTLEWQPP